MLFWNTQTPHTSEIEHYLAQMRESEQLTPILRAVSTKKLESLLKETVTVVVNLKEQPDIFAKINDCVLLFIHPNSYASCVDSV